MHHLGIRSRAARLHWTGRRRKERPDSFERQSSRELPVPGKEKKQGTINSHREAHIPPGDGPPTRAARLLDLLYRLLVSPAGGHFTTWNFSVVLAPCAASVIWSSPEASASATSISV